MEALQTEVRVSDGNKSNSLLYRQTHGSCPLRGGWQPVPEQEDGAARETRCWEGEPWRLWGPGGGQRHPAVKRLRHRA